MNTEKYSREQLSCLKLIGFSYLQGVKRNEQKVRICSNFSPVSIPSSLARQDVPLCARPWEYFRRLGVICQRLVPNTQTPCRRLAGSHWLTL